MRNQTIPIKTFVGLIFALSVVFFASSATADVTRIYGEELQEMLNQGIPVIDVRRKDEWLSSGVIEGSHMLTFFDEKGRYDIQDWLTKLHKIVDKGQPFILICEAGIRTSSIARFLDSNLEYPKVYDVAGGIRMWIDNGGDVVSVSAEDI